MIMLLLSLAIQTASTTTRTLTLSGDQQTTLALGTVDAPSGQFVPGMSKPAGSAHLQLHVPLRILPPLGVASEHWPNGYPSDANPRIELFGTDPAIRFVDTSSGQTISLVKPDGTRDLAVNGGGLVTPHG